MSRFRDADCSSAARTAVKAAVRISAWIDCSSTCQGCVTSSGSSRTLQVKRCAGVCAGACPRQTVMVVGVVLLLLLGKDGIIHAVKHQVEPSRLKQHAGSAHAHTACVKTHAPTTAPVRVNCLCMDVPV